MNPTTAEKSVLLDKPYVPPKPWVELSDAEKIERLKEQVKSLISQHSSMYSQFYKIERKFYSHDHDPRDGKLISKLEQYDGGYIGGSTPGTGDSSKAYF